MDNTYLVADAPQVNVVNSVDDSVAGVKVRGFWNNELRYIATHQLRACTAEIPRAIIVDLGRLSDPTGASAEIWRTAYRYAAAQPSGTDLILAAVPPPLLNRLQDHTADTTILTAETVTTAHNGRADGGSPYRRTTPLPPSPEPWPATPAWPGTCPTCFIPPC